MIREWIFNQRGSVFLFTTALLILLLVMGGLAVDLFYLTTVDNEVQRAMDFAALAGAAKLGFDQTYFAGARSESEAFGEKNPLKIPVGSTMDLVVLPDNVNPADGDIVFGLWNSTLPRGQEWTLWTPGNPSTPATSVNAVMVQYRRAQVPMSFLNLLFDAVQTANPTKTSLTAGAHATAISPICAVPPVNPFPICVPCQKFFDAATGAWSSAGCGTPIQFISSSGGTPGPQPAGANTAGWCLPYQSQPNPSASNLVDYINGVTSYPLDQVIPTTPPNNTLDVQGGMVDPAFEAIKAKFTEMWNASGTLTVEQPSATGPPTVVYTGKGWAGWAPVVEFGDCADPSTGPNNVSGNDITILTYTKFVMTQVIGFTGGNPALPRPGFPANENGKCAVPNSADPITWPMCSDATIGNNYRAIFGYYSCERADVTASGVPGPRTCLTYKVKLVE